MQRRVNAKRLGNGLLIAAVAVLASALLTPLLTGLSYDRFTWIAYADVVYPTTETGDLGVAACSNGIDDDNDGFTDCQDADCAAVSPCSAPAPAASNTALLLLIALLTSIGLLRLYAKRPDA
jgi:hypothetical protein